MEATLTSFWVSLPARAGPEPRSWPCLTSTTFSQVSSPRVQHMGEGHKHSEHSPETTRCETPMAEEGRREKQVPLSFRATMNNEWSTALGRTLEGGKRGPGERPHLADTKLITTRTDLWCQPLQFPDTPLDHNSQK